MISTHQTKPPETSLRSGYYVHFAWVLACYSVMLVFLSLSSKKVIIGGDGCEYLTMVLAFQNHASPNALPEDIDQARQDILRLDCWFPQELTSFIPDKEGRRYCYHFWLYSLLVTPFKSLLEAAGQDGLRAFMVFNSLLFVLTLWIVYFKMNLPPRRNILLITLLALSPLSWYLIWSHPEIFCASLVTLGLVAHSRGRTGLALVLPAIAANHFPPIFLLCLLFLFLHALDRWRQTSPLRWALYLAALLPAFASPLFYQIHYGHPNLIKMIGMASFKYVTPLRLYEQIFDLNMGLLPFLPLVIMLFLGLMVHGLVKKRWRMALMPLVIVGMMVISATTSNWHHGYSGTNRYNTWLIPMILLYVIQHAPARRIFDGTLAASVFICLLNITYFGPFFFNHSHIDFTPISHWVVTHHPQLYSPTHETFHGLIAKWDDSARVTPYVVVDEDRYVRKILTDYEGMVRLKEKYKIKDEAYYQSVLERLTQDPTREQYVNVPRKKIKAYKKKS